MDGQKHYVVLFLLLLAVVRGKLEEQEVFSLKVLSVDNGFILRKPNLSEFFSSFSDRNRHSEMVCFCLLIYHLSVEFYHVVFGEEPPVRPVCVRAVLVD